MISKPNKEENERKILCLTCKHGRPPCAATAGSCNCSSDSESIVCRVKLNNLDDPYDFDPYTCKYYFPVYLRMM